MEYFFNSRNEKSGYKKRFCSPGDCKEMKNGYIMEKKEMGWNGKFSVFYF